jgi:hypothetical protein
MINLIKQSELEDGQHMRDIPARPLF